MSDSGVIFVGDLVAGITPASELTVKIDFVESTEHTLSLLVTPYVGNGNIHLVGTPTDDEATDVQVKAAQDHLGGDALTSATLPVTSRQPIPVTLTDLDSNTDFYIQAFQEVA